jgi:hypothetical protein
MSTRDHWEEAGPDRIKGRVSRQDGNLADKNEDPNADDASDARSSRAFAGFCDSDESTPEGRKRKMIATYFGDLILENTALRLSRKMRRQGIGPDAVIQLQNHIAQNKKVYQRDIDQVIGELAHAISDEELLEKLGIFLIEEAKRGDIDCVWELLEHGANINHVEVATGFTALHYAAARQARWLVKLLTRYKPQKINYLVTDRKGRLPSVLAFEVAANSTIGTFLMRKEVKCAQDRGIDYRALLTGEINA